MKPAEFASADEWRTWLETHHAKATDLVVRCWKTGTGGKRGLTYREALDEALCYGWIDGVRRRGDDRSFSVRFSPRRPNSVWSAVNIRRLEELEAAGRVRPAGRAAFERRTERRSRVYSYENPATELVGNLARRFKRNRKAWAFFQGQPPWYRKTSIFWVSEAKREETRARRFETLLACSAAGKRVPPLSREQRG